MLLYSSMDREEFMELQHLVPGENAKYLRLCSLVTAGIFALAMAASLIAKGRIQHNTAHYAIMLCINAALYIIMRWVEPNHHGLTTPLTFVYMAALYGFSGVLAMIHSDVPSVTTVAILLLMPQLFIYPPAWMMTATALAVLYLCGVTACCKPAEYLSTEYWNLLSFGLAAMGSSVIQARVKYQLLREIMRNKHLSEIDLLTGARNRNAYQQERRGYAIRCKESVTCVFADVNGLHELNNSQGHDAGDRMLKTMAQAMFSAFGASNTYRVGGDEFVAFLGDVTAEDVESRIRQIHETLAEPGYHASIGFAAAERTGLDIDTLIREAEQAMYREKQTFYTNERYDRRKNR